jgi:nucleoside-diphosphate-sugar epimerase
LALYLVTGGAGFIGSHTVEELIGRGESVRVLDDLSTGPKENLSAVLDKIDFYEGDIRDLDKIRPLFEGVNYVIHFAAASSVLRSIKEPVETTQVNLMGTLHVLVAAREAQGDGGHGRDLR